MAVVCPLTECDTAEGGLCIHEKAMVVTAVTVIVVGGYIWLA